ncbi:hypothetical protein [Vogesella sp. LIG4]|uniref:hypothetical protein n=1 Tax=Vogesella sp. LIG4 TaxID=1192162 RepID=UPI00081FFEB9|nr:hypothetical protein [Vogesella sp. LIG4]SCK16229.1 hypothetical protein PSELUDRAFT_1639 [Vogesella sp. LIG4]
MMENSRTWSNALPAQLPAVSLNIFCDVERLAAHAAGSVLSTLAQWQQRQLPCIMESLFPEVRTLAHLAAGSQRPSAADWLAARVVVFQLEHLMLGCSELQLMDAVNASLKRLGKRLGLELASLQSFAISVTNGPAVAATGRFALQAKLPSPVAQSLQLRRDLAPHLARLHTMLTR